MNFYRNQNQASISQKVLHNGDHVFDSSQESAGTRHFNALFRSSINRNIPQENPLHTDTFAQVLALTSIKN